MMRVLAGKFLYGDEKGERELPEFWIDKSPVTNAEYARFVTATGHDPPTHWGESKIPPKGITNHPVVYVSWHDAKAYAVWAGKFLPTEEEWEKAARGTDGREYPWGNQVPTARSCNFGDNEGGTTPVGRYSPQGDSPYGCVDMAGNVWEWTTSRHEEGRQVVRGGSFSRDSDRARCAYRGRYRPNVRSQVSGFRTVVSLISPSSTR